MDQDKVWLGARLARVWSRDRVETLVRDSWLILIGSRMLTFQLEEVWLTGWSHDHLTALSSKITRWEPFHFSFELVWRQVWKYKIKLGEKFQYSFTLSWPTNSVPHEPFCLHHDVLFLTLYLTSTWNCGSGTYCQAKKVYSSFPCVIQWKSSVKSYRPNTFIRQEPSFFISTQRDVKPSYLKWIDTPRYLVMGFEVL